MSDRAKALRVLAALKRSPVGDAAILVGSSGLFGFETGVPALTEDVDISIPESLAEQRGRAIVEALGEQGFEHEPGTATFTGADGTTFDLLGHGDPKAGDHVGGTEALHVMVFEDLSRLLEEEAATARLPQGGRALTPAGFVASKLLTERAHKGAKDKIQALLVLAERQDDESFVTEVARFLRSAGPVRLDDVRAGAQSALLSLEKDPTFSDAGAEGYAPVLKQAESGSSNCSFFWTGFMAEGRKRGATAEERLAELQRDRDRLRRERLLRQVAGPRWHRMARIVPVLFRQEGRFVAHVLRAERAVVIEALKQDGVFALDTAMRLAHGYGFLAVQEIQVYLTSPEPVDRLARQGLIDATPCPDTTLIRPWAGPPRLLACIVERLPPSRPVEGGYQVVTSERLGRELIGAVGPRADLFALYEKAEGRAPSPAGV